MRTARYYTVRSLVRLLFWGSTLTAVTLGLLVAATPAHSSTSQPVRTVTVTMPAPAWSTMLPSSMRKPCAEEDSVNCYWDASKQGNGKGHSFVVRLVPGKAHMVCVFYVKAADAKRWDYCEAEASHS